MNCGVGMHLPKPPQEKKAMPKDQDVINPEHYKDGGIEPFDYMRAKLSPEGLEGFAVGNVIKYISRYRKKNGLEDLRKSRWYLDKLIEMLEKE